MKKAAITIVTIVYLIKNVWRVHKYIDFRLLLSQELKTEKKPQ